MRLRLPALFLATILAASAVPVKTATRTRAGSRELMMVPRDEGPRLFPWRGAQAES